MSRNLKKKKVGNIRKFFSAVFSGCFALAALTVLVLVFVAGASNMSKYDDLDIISSQMISSVDFVETDSSSDIQEVSSELVSSKEEESSSQEVSSKEESVPEKVLPKKLKPSKTKLTLAEGGSGKITLKCEPSNAELGEIKWSSTNTTVASVKDGVVYGEKAGECTIKATLVANPDISCSVTVVVTRAVTSKYKIVIYLKSQSIGVYQKDSAGNYTDLIKVFTCSTGTDSNPTPTGTYKILRKFRWRELMGPSWGQYCSSISSAYLLHSEPYNRYNDPSSMSMSGYKKLGSQASHGCIRLACIDAKWIYDNMPIGTTVSIVKDSGPKGPTPVPLKSGDEYYGWDPTDPNPDNPYNKKEEVTSSEPVSSEVVSSEPVSSEEPQPEVSSETSGEISSVNQ